MKNKREDTFNTQQELGGRLDAEMNRSVKARDQISVDAPENAAAALTPPATPQQPACVRSSITITRVPRPEVTPESVATPVQPASPSLSRFAIHMRKKRDDSAYRESERERNTAARREKRALDSEGRKLEQERDQQARAASRNDPLLRSVERERDALARAYDRNSFESNVATYENGIRQGPTLTCVCCGGLFFSDQVVRFKYDEIRLKHNGPGFLNLVFHVDRKSVQDNE